MAALNFTKKANTKLWISDALTIEDSSVGFHIVFPDERKNPMSIIVQTKFDGTNDWASRADVQFSYRVWEEVVNGIAPGQKVRLVVSEEPATAEYYNL